MTACAFWTFIHSMSRATIPSQSNLIFITSDLNIVLNASALTENIALKTADWRSLFFKLFSQVIKTHFFEGTLGALAKTLPTTPIGQFSSVIIFLYE